RPTFVDGAVRSALAQHYDAIEVCIVDDGSSPPLRLADDLLADHRVQVHRVHPSVGAAAARNLAVAHSHGELIAFLDDDDEWLPDKTVRQVQLLMASPSRVAGVQCGWELWQDDGLVFTFVPDPDRDLRLVLLEHATMAPSSVMLRRSAFDAAGGFDPDLLRMEDWDLWLRVADRFEVALMPDVLVRRSGHPGRLVAALELPYREVVIERLRPRLEALPADDRRRLELHHGLDIARHQARAKQRGRALLTFLRLWRRAPGTKAIYKGVFVTFVVETRLWRIGRSVRRRFWPQPPYPPHVRSW
ncbi:MAG: hypothetical protein QOD38_2041, partial [Acidimicrobiaceae bacterium]